jgi:hypothetical protein
LAHHTCKLELELTLLCEAQAGPSKSSTQKAAMHLKLLEATQVIPSISFSKLTQDPNLNTLLFNQSTKTGSFSKPTHSNLT